MELQDKVSIVTGASRGIGLAVVRLLADRGATVFGVARSAPGEPINNATFLRADVRERDQVEEVIETVLASAGRIDILVNNAGVELVKPFVDTTDDDYNQMLETNLKGTFLFVRAVIPIMQNQRAGHLIFINSVSGIRGFSEDAVYCASKYGLAGLADALDEELRGLGIQVTSVHPGATDTSLALDSWAPADDPRRPYFLRAEDVAGAVVYAASTSPNVVVKQIIIQPLIEPSHSEFLPVEVVEKLIGIRVNDE